MLYLWNEVAHEGGVGHRSVRDGERLSGEHPDGLVHRRLRVWKSKLILILIKCLFKRSVKILCSVFEGDFCAAVDDLVDLLLNPFHHLRLPQKVKEGEAEGFVGRV